jgi:hypothetical protein
MELIIVLSPVCDVDASNPEIERSFGNGGTSAVSDPGSCAAAVMGKTSRRPTNSRAICHQCASTLQACLIKNLLVMKVNGISGLGLNGYSSCKEKKYVDDNITGNDS